MQCKSLNECYSIWMTHTSILFNTLHDFYIIIVCRKFLFYRKWKWKKWVEIYKIHFRKVLHKMAFYYKFKRVQTSSIQCVLHTFGCLPQMQMFANAVTWQNPGLLNLMQYMLHSACCISLVPSMHSLPVNVCAPY